MFRALSSIALAAFAFGAILFAGTKFELGIRPADAQSSPSAYVCKSKYALCTTAKCVAIPGHPGQVSCTCDVIDGFSFGTSDCQASASKAAGELILSRYYPVSSLVVCKNNEKWADCLNKPCLVDKKDPSKASCACNVKQNSGAYVIVTNKYTKSACTSGKIISSATLSSEIIVTNFLRLNKLLPARPYAVLNP